MNYSVPLLGFPLTLSLLVFRILTNHHDRSAPSNRFAFFTHMFNRWSDFHDKMPPLPYWANIIKHNV